MSTDTLLLNVSGYLVAFVLGTMWGIHLATKPKKKD